MPFKSLSLVYLLVIVHEHGGQLSIFSKHSELQRSKSGCWTQAAVCAAMVPSYISSFPWLT